MHYEYYEEAQTPAKKVVLITGFTVIRADSPGHEEILLNISDGTETNGSVNFTTKRNVTLPSGSLKSMRTMMRELYVAVASAGKLPPGSVK